MLSPAAVLKREFGSQLHLTHRARDRLRTFKEVKLSEHALMRGRQRGITQVQIAVMLAFGRSVPAGKNQRSYSFDKASRRELQRVLGEQYTRICDRMDYYLIVNEHPKEVITCCHRLRHHRRK